MAHILVILIILACIGFLFLRGNVVKSFAFVFSALFAAFASFGFYEILAKFLISRATESLSSLVPWMHSISFLIIYLLSFVVSIAIITQLTRQQIDFGKIAEPVVRIASGIIIGLVFSGVALIVLAMAPLPAQYPYQRFDPVKPDLKRPKKVLFNPDGFISWLFAETSDGSLSAITNKKSFAALHPDFIDQIHLNKIGIDKKIPTTSATDEIVVPSQNASWFAPQSLVDTANKSVSPKAGNILIVVRVGIKRLYGIRLKSIFNMAQLRLICKSKSNGTKLTGTGSNFYPIGYLESADTMRRTDINYALELTSDDLTDNFAPGIGKLINFVFEVPNDLAPVAVEFRQNNIAQVPAPLTSDKAPPVFVFIPTSECATNSAEVEPALSAKIFGTSMEAKTKLLAGLSLNVTTIEEVRRLITEDNNNPPGIENNKFNYAVVKLENKTAFENSNVPSSTILKGLPTLLKPLDGYNLLSLKCNNPPIGSQIKSEDLPVLVDVNDKPNYPVGLIASGRTPNGIIYQFDYCSVIASEDNENGLLLDKSGNVTKSFPRNIWITENQEIESINEFFLLYLIKNGVIITKVQPPGSVNYQTFRGYQGFLVK